MDHVLTETSARKLILPTDEHLDAAPVSDDRGSSLVVFEAGRRQVTMVIALAVACLVAEVFPTEASAQDVLAALPALTAMPKGGLSNGATLYVRGYSTEDDGGGGTFRWQADSVAAAIQGMVLPADEGGSGRWFRIVSSEISDKMTGAKVDGETYDDEAIAALAAYVTSYPVRRVSFAAGVRKVLQAEYSHTPFEVTGIHGLLLLMTDCVFQIGKTQEAGSSNVFCFNACKDVQVVGRPEFSGNLTSAFIETVGSATGTVGMQFVDDCSGARFSIRADGIQCPFLFARRPRLTVDPMTAPCIGAGGVGYTVGDILTLSNIGATATRNATFRVAAVKAGVVTSVTVVGTGLFPFNNAANGLNNDVAGFAVSGGTGSGCLLMPYMLDYDIATMPRNLAIEAMSTNCFYGGQFQFSGCDSVVRIDADFVYRSLVYYGGPRRNEVFIRQRNVRGDAFASGSSMGLGSDVDLVLVQLPTTSTTFANNNSLARWAYGSGMAAKCAARITYDVNVSAAGNYFGSVFEIDKHGLNNSDTIHARGHFGDFVIGGRIRGLGRKDSGMGQNWGGTNVNISQSAWTGEKMRFQLRDDLRCTGGGAWIFAAKSLVSLIIGKVVTDGAITTDFTTLGSLPALSGPISVDPSAAYSNRFGIDGERTP